MIPAIIYGALSVLPVGERIYRGQGPQDVRAPYATWTTLAGVPDNNLSLPPSDRVTVRVNVYGRTERESDSLMFAARAALEGIGQVGTVQDLGYDTDTKDWRYALDADVHVQR